MARIAVGVATGDDADAQRALGDEGAAIADAIARRELLDADDPALERHHRLQPEAFGAALGEGTGTVEHNARPHPIGMGRRVAQQSRRIGQAYGSAPVSAQRGKTRHLLVDAPAVRFGEMGHQGQLGVVPSGEHFTGLFQVDRSQAEPVHAGIELEVDRQRRVAGHRGKQQFQLFQAVNNRGQAKFRDGPRVTRTENALEQQDRLGDAGFAQGDGVFAFEHGKAVGLRAQRFDRPPLPVAIGIGLDHRPCPGVRGQPFGQPVVMQQRAAGNARADRTGSLHAAMSLSCCLTKSTKVATSRERKRSSTWIR